MSGKSQIYIELYIAQYPAAPKNEHRANAIKKTAEKEKFIFYCSALFHMKTRVCPNILSIIVVWHLVLLV